MIYERHLLTTSNMNNKFGLYSKKFNVVFYSLQIHIYLVGAI